MYTNINHHVNKDYVYIGLGVAISVKTSATIHNGDYSM